MVTAIGWIGLGRIGMPMAERVIAAGFAVRSWDIDSRLAAGTRVSTAAETAREAEAVLLCLPDDMAVEQVAFGPDGIAGTAAPGTVIIDHSSISPDRTRDFARRAADAGLAWVDAPISGGPERARTATLVAWLGGDDDTIARIRPVIAAFADRIWHLGPVGSGQIAKSCNQAIVCITAAAWAEMLGYARQMGLDREQIVAALEGAGADSATGRNFAGGLARGNFPELSSRNFRKDLGIVRALAADAGVTMPLADAAAAMFARGLVEPS